MFYANKGATVPGADAVVFHRTQISGASICLPKELSHREAPLLQHRAQQLSQVQPDVRNVDGHVISLL